MWVGCVCVSNVLNSSCLQYSLQSSLYCEPFNHDSTQRLFLTQSDDDIYRSTSHKSLTAYVDSADLWIVKTYICLKNIFWLDMSMTNIVSDDLENEKSI